MELNLFEVGKLYPKSTSLFISFLYSKRNNVKEEHNLITIDMRDIEEFFESRGIDIGMQSDFPLVNYYVNIDDDNIRNRLKQIGMKEFNEDFPFSGFTSVGFGEDLVGACIFAFKCLENLP